MWSVVPFHSFSTAFPFLTAFCSTTPKNTGPVSTASRAWLLVVEGGSRTGAGTKVCFCCKEEARLISQGEEQEPEAFWSWCCLGCGSCCLWENLTHPWQDRAKDQRAAAGKNQLLEAEQAISIPGTGQPGICHGWQSSTTGYLFHFAFSCLYICRHKHAHWHSEQASLKLGFGNMKGMNDSSQQH